MKNRIVQAGIVLALAAAGVGAAAEPAGAQPEAIRGGKQKVTYDRAKLTPEALAALAAGQPGGEVWGKAFDKPKVSLREAALEELRLVIAGTLPEGQWKHPSASVRFYREFSLPITGTRSPELAAKHPNLQECWLVQTAQNLTSMMALYSRECGNQTDASLGLDIARHTGDTIINMSLPSDWAYACFPIPHKHMGPLWNDYLNGKVTFEAWRDEMRARCEKRYELIWDCRIADPGMTLLELYDVTKDEKYFEAAKRLAASFATNQLPSGTWPYFVNAKTGEGRGGEWPPALTIWFLDRLADQYGVKDYQKTADRAFAWMWENQVVPHDMRAHYWDVAPKPRGSQGSLAAAEIAMCLFNRGDREPTYIPKGEEILNWIEKSFVSWDQGGKVSEQTGFRLKVRFAGGGVAEAFVKAYEVTGNPIYLAKGLAIFSCVVRDRNEPPEWMGSRATGNFLAVYPFLKQHNLPGSE